MRAAAEGALPPALQRAVLIWSGLRGALTITLVLALPPETPNRDLLLAMSFGVVLFSLVVQGLPLPLLLRRLGLAEIRPPYGFSQVSRRRQSACAAMRACAGERTVDQVVA